MDEHLKSFDDWYILGAICNEFNFKKFNEESASNSLSREQTIAFNSGIESSDGIKIIKALSKSGQFNRILTYLEMLPEDELKNRAYIELKRITANAANSDKFLYGEDGLPI